MQATLSGCQNATDSTYFYYFTVKYHADVLNQELTILGAPNKDCLIFFPKKKQEFGIGVLEMS